MKQTGYPQGRPGYVVDHIIPLNRDILAQDSRQDANTGFYSPDGNLFTCGVIDPCEWFYWL